MITADRQTEGIGCHERKWHSPKGVNIYTTFIIPLEFNQNLLQILPIITCVTISLTLEYFNCETKIKWVADILLDEENKVAGVLIESALQGDVWYVLIGIGINVNMNEEEFINIDKKATSMKVSAGREFNRDAVLDYLKRQLQDNISNFNHPGKEKATFIEYYDKKLASKNCKVKIEEKNGKESLGVIKGIDKNGCLELLLEQGEEGQVSWKTFYDGRLFPITTTTTI